MAITTLDSFFRSSGGFRYNNPLDGLRLGNRGRNRFRDPYENNNNRRRAFDLSDSEGISLRNLEGFAFAENRDFYKIEVSEGANRVVVDVDYFGFGNVRLVLLDADGNVVERTRSGSIDTTVAEAGTYFIKVAPIRNSVGVYDLVWDDLLPETTFRTIDGHDNNLDNPDFGAEGQPLLRLAPNAYADGLGIPRGVDLATGESTLPSARAISNAVAAQSESILNSFNATDWFWQWGQFIDHDFGITEGLPENGPFNILVPQGDPQFDPFNTGTVEIPLDRSIFEIDPVTGVREQINEITAYIDGSNVYGSTPERAEALRAHDGTGRLLTQFVNGEELLPFNTFGLPNANATGLDPESLFLAGDVRANEQVGLAAVHTLFVREHNRLADQIGIAVRTDGNLTNLFLESGLELGDFVYQAARRVVGAQIQVITYNEFLPLLLGEDALDSYTGYDATVNPQLSTEFSAAAFRLGHSLLSSDLLQVDPETGNVVGTLSLQESFFSPDLTLNDGIDSLLLGLASQNAQELDENVVEDIRSFLFGPPGAGGLDLASLNIQRGRDHGIPGYNAVREALGLGAVDGFDDITSNPLLQQQLASVYSSVDDVDLWIGGLIEDDLLNSQVGETFQAILVDQFTRLRDGDRFFYEGDELLQTLGSSLGVDFTERTLADVINDNSTVTGLQNAFILANPVVI